MLIVHAREFRGTSSEARIPMSRARAVERPRATVWLEPSQARLGAKAPVAATAQAPYALNRIRVRRPRRSAVATRTRAMRTPTRVAARAMPWARSEAPNSSAAKVMVCEMSVPV